MGVSVVAQNSQQLREKRMKNLDFSRFRIWPLGSWDPRPGEAPAITFKSRTAALNRGRYPKASLIVTRERDSHQVWVLQKNRRGVYRSVGADCVCKRARLYDVKTIEY